MSWLAVCALTVSLGVFGARFFSWKICLLGLFYSMVVLGTHGTIYLHRYCTHRAYKFSNSFARFFVRNLTPKIISEEVYVVSHLVHHQFVEQPGDPYNVHGGWLYCFLADVTHQRISQNLSPEDYARLAKVMDHTGVKLNTYEQYQRWGTLSHPARAVAHFALNWLFWYGAFYVVGGHALATGIFGMSAIWAVGVRTFNYDGHGAGKDKRQVSVDFNRDDLSVNQIWPGYVASEWHNNHHLYPNSAICGFLPYQLDLAWCFIWFYFKIGGISSYRNNKDDFLRDHYLPFLRLKNSVAA